MRGLWESVSKINKQKSILLRYYGVHLKEADFFSRLGILRTDECSINRTRNVHKDYKIRFYCKKLSAELIEFTLETSLDFIRWTCASRTGRGSSLISHFWNILRLWSRGGACAWSRSVRRRVLGVHAPLSEIMSSERALDTTVMMCHTVCRYNDIITVMFG